ncbi:DUF1850 domain-containing protein [Micrococcus terreus]|uniref:DUF1850 domain-containing protein n=1 Tax=Micrococcus terreus TaxID=574650 RepID=UPI00340972CA
MSSSPNDLSDVRGPRFSRRTALTLAAVTGLTAVTATGAVLWPRSPSEIVCADQRTGEEWGRWAASPGSEISLTWIHSIELTPWTDVFVLEESEGFTLTRTEFESYGAGMPAGEASTSVQDGKVVITDIGRHLDTVNWIHSHSQQFTLTLDGKIVAHPLDLPHHRPLELRSA